MARYIDTDKLIMELNRREEELDLTGYDVFCFEEMINAQPTAEKNGEWIPCSERLPKMNAMYIGLDEYSEDDDPYIYESDRCLMTDGKSITIGVIYKDGGTMDLLNGGEIFPNLTAWMPLPEPYKEEGDKDV